MTPALAAFERIKFQDEISRAHQFPLVDATKITFYILHLASGYCFAIDVRLAYRLPPLSAIRTLGSCFVINTTILVLHTRGLRRVALSSG